MQPLTEIGGIRFVEPKAGRGKEDDFASPTNGINCCVAPKVRWHICFLMQLDLHRLSLTLKPDNHVEDEAKDDDEDAAIDWTYDIPSRNRLKINSKMHVNARRQETRKKRVKQQ